MHRDAHVHVDIIWNNYTSSLLMVFQGLLTSMKSGCLWNVAMCPWLCFHTHVHTYIHTWILCRYCIHICLHDRFWRDISTQVPTYIHTHVFIHTHVYTCLCVCVCVCVYIYIYIYYAGVTHVLIVRSTLERRLDPKFPELFKYHIVEVPEGPTENLILYFTGIYIYSNLQSDCLFSFH